MSLLAGNEVLTSIPEVLRQNEIEALHIQYARTSRVLPDGAEQAQNETHIDQAVTDRPNEQWALDYTCMKACIAGTTLRMLNVIDEGTRQWLAVRHVGTSGSTG